MFITEKQKNDWRYKNRHFPRYVDGEENMEKQFRRLTRELKQIRKRDRLIDKWYNELHDKNTQTQWIWKSRPVDWKNLLSFIILNEEPSVPALKAFIHDVYDQENPRNISFSHVVEALQHQIDRHHPSARLLHL